MKKITTILSALGIAATVVLSPTVSEAATSSYWNDITVEGTNNPYSWSQNIAKSLMIPHMTPPASAPVVKIRTRELGTVYQGGQDYAGLYVPPGSTDPKILTTERGVFVDDDLADYDKYITLVTVHEMAHWFATAEFQSGGKWADIIAALKATDAYDHWKDVAAHNPSAAVRAEYTYLKDSGEMFARAVAQWIGKKAYGNDFTWTDADFAPVATVLNAKFN
jgi:hypothetical protein